MLINRVPFRQPGESRRRADPSSGKGILYAVVRRVASPRARPQRGELGLIEMIRKRAAEGPKSSALQLGIGDDCAILQPPAGHEVLVTTDFSLEGRHFRRDWHSPEAIGHRTLARGLSDLASMGGKPLGAFLSLALPRSVAANSAWLNSFLDGLLGLAEESRVPLAGGDLSEAPAEHVLADIVLLGSAPTGTAMRRSGARTGDLLYCTGALGGAMTELTSLSSGKSRRSRMSDEHPHLFPAPRLRVGDALRRKHLASACIDLSDGLSTDLLHLCEASGVSAEVHAAQLPVHRLTARLSREDALHAALHGGEDYELLFTASPSVKIPRAIAGVTITPIGTVSAPPRSKRSTITLVRDTGGRTSLQRAGWEHLR